MEARLSQIKKKLVAAGKVLNPVLSSERVVAFERRHRISLPEGYRKFLLEVGNGGDGPPYYKLVSLGQGPSPNKFNKEEVRYWKELPHVHLAFAFTKAWVWEDGEVSEEGSREQVQHGNIFLGTDGCGMNWHLIITGEERGRIWWLSGEGIQPTNPKRDFLRWYEDWLDGVENWWEMAEPNATDVAMDAKPRLRDDGR